MIAAMRRCALIAFLFVCAFAALAHAAPVLMISLDGLKPEYITQADAHGMKIPYLRSFVNSGTYAEGVTGVWPTVTYPSHTTLITGVTPAEHGVYNNHQFDPTQSFGDAWNWYAAEIRVPTLWQAAHRAGLGTASVGWPVSVGATDVDWLIPEFWRSAGASGASGELNPLDQMLIAALARPETLIQSIEPVAGSYMLGNDTTTGGDEAKTRYALEILRRYKPAFTTVHLSSLDETEHEHGPFSPEACQDLEALDGMVARLAQQALANDPATVIVVVSDHGFMRITHNVNIAIPFIQTGLIQATVEPGKAPLVKSWKAEPWGAGGMAAIMLHDPNDSATEQQVKGILDKLAANPENGIAEVLDREQIKQRGGFPDAAFLVVLKPGYYTAAALSGDFVTPIAGTRGSHGFSPELAEMRASFFAQGAGIAAQRNLGVIDMRQIAPTVAGLLNVSLPTAKAAPLNVKP